MRFKGFIKVGLDSSTIIHAIDSGKFVRKPFYVYYYHEVSIKEVVGVLIHRFRCSPCDARRKLELFIRAFDAQMIERIPLDKKLERSVQAVNGIGEKDIRIVAGFIREKMIFVCSRDKAFLRTCGKLGFKVYYW